MATFTAQILIGQSHQLSGGIIPTHCLFLSEGTKPVWILKNLDILEDHSSLNTVRWVPSQNDNILQDALLMISIYVLKDKFISMEADKYFNAASDNYIDLSKDISSSNLQRLHHICKELKYDYKLIISCFNGSLLENSLNILGNYSMDVEICKSSYNRFYNPWRDKVITKGIL